MILNSQEKKILLSLQKKHKQNVEELVKDTGLKQASVSHACAWLSSKDLLKIHEKTEERIKLGKEGKEYLEKGLPERWVLEEVKDEERSISNLNKKLGEDVVRIASVWLRKKNLALILDGKVRITPNGKKILGEKLAQEKILELISKNKEVPKELKEELKALKKRGEILKISEVKERSFEITEKGEKVSKKDLEIEEEISILTPSLIKGEKWKKKKIREYDVEAPVPILHPGKKQMYKEFIDEAKDILVGMGFREAKGPIIELEFWNFDVLYQAQKHPAREVHAAYKLKSPKSGTLLNPELVDRVKQTHENGWITKSKGWNYKWDEGLAAETMLRSQTTCVSAREMVKLKDYPARIFCLGKNFRPDVIDASHLPEFYQFEGIIIDESLTLRDLLGLLKEFAMQIAHIKEIKFKAAYFPFTEPSVEIFGKHPVIGWTELAGSGMFRPEMRLPLGVEVPVAAWAFGIDRLAMFKYGLRDIRELYSKDLDILRKTPVL